VKERPLNKRTIFALSLVFLSLLPIPRAESAMVELTLEQLVKEADLIVVGTVESVKSELTQGKIFSFATITVNSKVKGELNQGQDKIVVRFAGGTVGDIGMKVENSPNYQKNEKVIAFVEKVPNTSYYRTLGSFQGKFVIEGNFIVRANLKFEQFLDRIDAIMQSGP
jgi:hypothetical protein